MEIPSWLFMSFWGVISITSLNLGFLSLDKTELSHSVSAGVMFLFKHSLAVSSCFSSNYALKFRSQSRCAARSHSVLLLYIFFSFIVFPRTRIIEEILYILLTAPFAWVPYIPYFDIFSKILSILSLIEMFGVFCILNYNLIQFCNNNFSETKTRSGILLALEIFLLFASADTANFSPILVLSISHLISVLLAALPRFGDYTFVSAEGEGLQGLVNVGVRFVDLKIKGIVWMLKKHKAKKFIEFAVGTVGAILFQNFFRITSFSEVAAFLYFAVTWLANLVLLGFRGDFGVFNFLLANVVVGCTVGQFGLHRATWIALAAALLLFALRLKLESLPMVYREGQRIQLFFFADDFVVPPHHLPL